MSDAETAYDSNGTPYAPLDLTTALRYARAAENRYAGSELPEPDLEPGICDDCQREAHARWTRGPLALCRHCIRQRLTAGKPQPEPKGLASILLPHFHGECQRCPHHTEHGLLTIVAKRFLCALHAKHALRAQRAAKARADHLKGSDT